MVCWSTWRAFPTRHRPLCLPKPLPSAQRLTLALQIVFSEMPTVSLEALSRCAHLCELSLLNTSLRSLPPVSAVARTLTRLVLQRQPLQRLDGMGAAPALRELIVTSCQVRRLDGLEGCRNLRRLWCYENEIESLEGATCLSDLRELWCQANRIRSLQPLQGMVSLQVLAVSGNPLRRVADLEPLSFLPALRDLSCDDKHFAACELCDSPGYYEAVVNHLGQVTTLDGVDVSGNERHEMKDEYLARALAFNDRTEMLKEAHHQRQDELARLRQRNEMAKAAMRSQFEQKLRQVQSMLADSRAKVVKDLENAARMRAHARAELEDRLAALQRRHAAAADHAIRAAEADAAHAAEEAERMTRQARFQQSESERLLALCTTTEGRTFAHEANRHGDVGADEYDFIASELASALDLPAEAGAPADRDWRSLDMYRITDIEAQGRFGALGDEHGTHGSRWVWLGCGLETLHRMLEMTHHEQGVQELLTYYARPADAAEAQLSARRPPAARLAAASAGVDAAENVPGGGDSGLAALLLCQVWMATKQQLDAAVLRRRPAETLPLYYVQLCDGEPALQGEDAFADIAEATRLSGKAIPSPACADAHAEMDAVEAEAAAAIREYRHQLWFDFDPELADRVRREEEEADAFEASLREMKEATLHQHDAQDAMLCGVRDDETIAAVAAASRSRGAAAGRGAVPPKPRRAQSARPSRRKTPYG